MLSPNLRVFVDGGGNDYNGVERYLKKLPSFDQIYVFEPNPFFFDSYKNSNLTLIKKAIWINDCTLPFYISRDDNQVASSLLEEKLCKVNSQIVPYWHDKPVEVECIDFSRWLKENINANHHLTLKLDIEGAEYDVLWKMITDGTISYVKSLYVEFHLDTVKSKKAEHEQLIQALKDHGINPNYWD